MKAKKGGIKVKEGGDSETAIPSQKVKKQIAPSPGNKSTPVGKKNQKKKVPSDVQVRRPTGAAKCLDLT